MRSTSEQSKEPETRASLNPTFVVVIPVYQHSVLLIEALDCALAEAKALNGAVVLVNDGCPYLETHEYCLDFARALPDVISYIKTSNGGLSAARNHGIRFALDRYPSCEAIYLLDADNRLTAGALRRSLAVMHDTNADWVYPGIDKFGLEWSGDYSAPYLILRHLQDNICEAGSLVKTNIFEAGIWFDEGMTLGFEDWDFWLQCLGKGFRGAPCAEMGFQYRSRRESMLRNSDRERSELVGYLQRKHQGLFNWNNILKLEQDEAPRYCVVDYAAGQYNFTSAAGVDTASKSLMHLDEAFWRADFYSDTFHFPNYIVSIHASVVKELKRLKLIDWIFWHIEDALEHCQIVAVVLEPSAANLSVETTHNLKAGGLPKAIHILATTRGSLREFASDANTQRTDSLRTETPEPTLHLAKISAPFSAITVRGVAASSSIAAFIDVLGRLRASFFIGTKAKWRWREANLPPSGEIFRYNRKLTQSFAPLARASLSDEKEIAIVLPILSFGGVEQVGLQVAARFKFAGWKTRLVLTQVVDIPDSSRVTNLFDAVCFLNDPVHARWNPAGAKYYGHDLQRWAVDGRRERLLGLLAGCSAVISFHAMQVNEVTGWLRRQGVVTASSMHLIDRDAYSAPVGHPYMLLPYEHAYDLITAPSKQLLDVMSGLGVPADKLLLLRNTPTFVVDTKIRAARLKDLKGERASRPLRVLYVGRLDRQKGMERLQSVVQGAQNLGLPIEWRVIGSHVIASDGGTTTFAPGIKVEPPVYARSEVMQRLLWADVILLLSHWEGAPLIILEAQSTGTIPVATDVGAVNELIDPGQDGYLVPNGSLQDVTEQTLDILSNLAMSPQTCARVAEAAMERVRSLDSFSTGDNLVEAVERTLLHKRKK